VSPLLFGEMITNWTILFKEPSKLPEVRCGRKANGSANSDLGARHNYYSQYMHIIKQQVSFGIASTTRC
jgi:hypothetical protein